MSHKLRMQFRTGARAAANQRRLSRLLTAPKEYRLQRRLIQFQISNPARADLGGGQVRFEIRDLKIA